MTSTGPRWDHGAHLIGLIGRWAIAMVKAYSAKGGAGFLGDYIGEQYLAMVRVQGFRDLGLRLWVAVEGNVSASVSDLGSV